MDQMQGRAEAGAKRGYLTASIDCRYHGRRCPKGEDKRNCYEHALVRSAISLMLTLPVITGIPPCLTFMHGVPRPYVKILPRKPAAPYTSMITHVTVTLGYWRTLALFSCWVLLQSPNPASINCRYHGKCATCCQHDSDSWRFHRAFP